MSHAPWGSISWATRSWRGWKMAVSVPLDWLPRLKDASDKDRNTFALVDGGEDIRWPTLDEDVSVPGLLGLPD